MKLYQLVLLTIIYGTASFAQTAEDAVLLSFETALKGSDQSHLDTFQIFKERYQEELTACPFRIKFYKAYANYQYSQERDDLVLQFYKDSILPMQQSCLAANHDNITTTLLNIARSYQYLTEFGDEDLLEEAEQYYLQVNERQAKSDSITAFHSKRYKDIAEFYNYIKDYKKAALYYESALNIYSSNKTSIVYIKLLLGRADCLEVVKKYHEAIRLLEEAVGYAQQKPDEFSIEQSLCYERLASCYKYLQQYELAEKYIIKARQIEQRREKRDFFTANAFASLHAQILKLSGKYDEAFAVYQEVKELIKAAGDKVSIKEVSGINENLGSVYYAKGDYVKAIELSHKGIADLVSFCPTDKYSNPPIDGNRIFNLQYLQRQLGLKAKAMLAYGKEQPDQAIFSGALDAVLKFDSLGQEILKQNWEEETHQIRIKELSPFYEYGIRAANELFTLTGNSTYLEAAHQVCSRYKSQLLHRGIAVKEKKKAVLSDSLIQIESELVEKISAFETAYLMDLTAENNTTESLKLYLDEKASLDKFHRDNEVYEEIENTTYNGATTTAEIRARIGTNTALLEYFVSKDSIHAFLITQGNIHYQVCSDKGLDQYSKYLLSGEGQHNSGDLKPLIMLLNKVDKQRITNLIIIPDQQLLQLPFESLQLNDEYLVEQFNISYQYSTSFLTEDKVQQTKNKYLGFASDYSSNNAQAAFANLPFAVEEITTAHERFGGTVFINEEATKSNFELTCENAGLIHLALHTKLNNEYPDQSSLVFQSDTAYEYLTASQIYNFDLNNDLTVLSACNTAVGQVNPGDGVRSITRSFIHAGSASVLTTLWEAPDVSTSRIITKFYKELEAGQPKDAALRNAKLEYINSVQPTYRHPKYWAHLVLVGDTDPLSQNNHWIKLILGLILLLFVGMLFFRRKSG